MSKTEHVWKKSANLLLSGRIIGRVISAQVPKSNRRKQRKNLPGLIDPGTLTVKVAIDPSMPGYNMLSVAFASRAVKPFRLFRVRFPAFVSAYSLEGLTDAGFVTALLTLHLAGPMLDIS